MVFNLRLKLKNMLPDIIALLFAFFVMASFILGALLLMGWMNMIINLPAAHQSGDSLTYWQTPANDFDGDGIPDVIEDAEPGEEVYVDRITGERVNAGDENAIYIGYGTGSDKTKRDTSGNGFPDNLEVKLGSNPNSWWNPGIIWFFWGGFIVGLVYRQFLYKPDRVKEYQRNEMMISQASIGKKTKFAYGGKIITKAYEEMNAEEREQAMLEDVRLRELTAFSDTRPDQRVKRGFPLKRILQFSIGSFFAFFFYWIIVGPI
jgi:hypothetical protein